MHKNSFTGKENINYNNKNTFNITQKQFILSHLNNNEEKIKKKKIIK